MENEKIIERVRKLMAMARDSSSPNEAAIAAKRARKLMDEYDIDFRALERGDGFAMEAVGEGKRFVHYWKQTLAIAIAELNDCIVDYAGVYKPGEAVPRRKIRFKGVDSDVETCVMMYQAIHDAVVDMCKSWMRSNHPGGYNARLGTRFKDGAVAEIRERCALICQSRQIPGAANQEVLVVKKQLVERKFGAANYGTSSKSIPDDALMEGAFVAGYQNAKSINLRDEVQDA